MLQSSSSSSTNFIATQVLKQNFRAAMCHVLHYNNTTLVKGTSVCIFINFPMASYYQHHYRHHQWWAVINYFLVNYVIKLLWSSWLQKFNYSKVIGNWVVVKLLFKVVNYQAIKLLKCSWRSFCLPVDSYPFTYVTGTIYLLITTVLLKWDRPTWYMTMQLDRLTMKQLLCAHLHEHCLSDN